MAMGIWAPARELAMATPGEPVGGVDEGCGVGAEALGGSRSGRGKVAIALQGQTNRALTVVDQSRRADLELADDGTHDACGGCGGARIV